jgi:hypothetical protein
MTNWVEIVGQHEDEILDAFMEANRLAALGYLHTSQYGNVIVVTIDTNGEIYHFCQGQNVVTGEVKDGTEKLLATFPVAGNWNFEDEDESLEVFLGEKFGTFQTWCSENDLTISVSALRDYNLGLYEEFVRDVITDTVYETSYDIATEKLQALRYELAVEEQTKREGLLHAAQERVDDIPELQEYEDILIKYDWSNWEEHIEWVATAPIDEILDWAKNDVRKYENQERKGR